VVPTIPPRTSPHRRVPCPHHRRVPRFGAGTPCPAGVATEQNDKRHATRGEGGGEGGGVQAGVREAVPGIWWGGGSVGGELCWLSLSPSFKGTASPLSLCGCACL